VNALLEWKRAVFSLYADIRNSSEPEAMWRRWRTQRDELFATHEQSPLTPEARRSFRGLPYFDYDPAMRVLGNVEPAQPQRYDITTSGDGTYSFTRYGIAAFELAGESLMLELYWVEGYGGGVFLPFRDGTSGSATYGAGRYLLDSIKGADLGTRDDKLVLDFNFSYNPSCAYDPRWVCPLAPPPNRLDVDIRAGERYSQTVG
jgi:uncharacterized protein (DUF1684 family)